MIKKVLKGEKPEEVLEDKDPAILMLEIDKQVNKLEKIKTKLAETDEQRLERIKVAGADADAKFDRRIDELKELKKLGIDINEYVKREQQITMDSTIKQPSSEEGSVFCPECGGAAEIGKFCQNCGHYLLKICPVHTKLVSMHV